MNHRRSISLIWFTAAALAAWAACGRALGSGDELAFAPQASIEIGPKSGQITLADFNSDGHVDILVNHPLHRRASLLLNDGRGAFPAAGRTTIAFDYDPGAIAVGDFSGDDRPDLAVAGREESTVVVHLHVAQAGGGFRESKGSSFAAGEIAERGWKPFIELIDLNGDQKLDLVSATGRRHTVEVFHGSGAGKFVHVQGIALEQGFNRYTHLVGDFDGDAHPDLAVAFVSDERPGRLVVLNGDGRGQFVTPPRPVADAPAAAYARTWCDINGDGRLDVVLTHGTHATVLVQGVDGQLREHADSPVDVGREAFAVAALPAPRGGRDRLVAATVDSLTLLAADDDGRLRVDGESFPAGPGAYQVAAGDLNGDGKTDVVANSFEGDALTVLMAD